MKLTVVLCAINGCVAKFDAELFRDVIHSLRPPAQRLPRKRFHFQLAEQSASDSLTGYSHNAVTPFGMNSNIPVVICTNCLKVTPPLIFLGGGEIDVKLGITLDDFMNAAKPIVGHISHMRAVSGQAFEAADGDGSDGF